jgi:fructoselysine 6-kinase
VSSTDRKPLLATVGDNCIDVLRFADGRVVRRIGGNAANVAVQAALAGAGVRYFGAVGPDEDGRLIREVLATRGVNVDGVRTRPGLTSMTEIEVTQDGERLIQREDFGVCRGYAPTAEDLRILLQADHVHIGWLDDGGELRRILASQGRSVSQDLSVNAAPRDLGVEGLSIAFGSQAGPPEPAERVARDWLSRGARLAVVTRGAAGAIVADGTGLWHIPAEPVEPVDTTGAGDSFIAGFLLARQSGASPPDAARAGARAARLTCLHDGGFPQS